MKSYFTSDFFAGNRRNLRALCAPSQPIVIAANGLLQRGADSTYAFAQDANFWYLTGLDEPDIVLVIHGDTEYLIVPERDDNREVFDGAVNDDELSAISGIAAVLGRQDGWRQLSQDLASGTVTTLVPAPAYIEHYGMYVNPARLALAEQLAKHGVIETTDAAAQMAALRVIKQPVELLAIQAAIDTTIDTLQLVSPAKQLATYRHEYELEADITRGFRFQGAQGHSFEPIVAGGRNACTLHNVANNDQLRPHELIVLDVGAEVEHYAADITRTVSASPPTARQQAVYDAVLAVQKFGFELIKPGTLMKDNEQAIEQYMGEKLLELGLITEITHANVRQYFPHSTSHFMGLNVHDIGDYHEPLAAGMVMTVEPGIYIPEESIGVRIEDDVLLTSTGLTILTDRLPRKLYQP